MGSCLVTITDDDVGPVNIHKAEGKEQKQDGVPVGVNARLDHPICVLVSLSDISEMRIQRRQGDDVRCHNESA